MSNIIDKLHDHVCDLDGADFSFDAGGTTVSSFSFSYGDIEDLELDLDIVIEAVDGMSTSDFVYLPKDVYEEILQELEEQPSGKGLLRMVRDFIDRLLGDNYD